MLVDICKAFHPNRRETLENAGKDYFICALKYSMVVTVPHVTVPRVTKLVSTELYHMKVFSKPDFTQIRQEM